VRKATQVVLSVESQQAISDLQRTLTTTQDLSVTAFERAPWVVVAGTECE
jgi:hypothetical protein